MLSCKTSRLAGGWNDGLVSAFATDALPVPEMAAASAATPNPLVANFQTLERILILTPPTVKNPSRNQIHTPLNILIGSNNSSRDRKYLA